MKFFKFIGESRAASFRGESYCQNYPGKVLTKQFSDNLDLFRHEGINKQRNFHEGGGVVLTHGPSDHYRTHLIGRHLMVSVTIPFGVWFTDQRTPPQKPISTYSSSKWNGIPVDVGPTLRGEHFLHLHQYLRLDALPYICFTSTLTLRPVTGLLQAESYRGIFPGEFIVESSAENFRGESDPEMCPHFFLVSSFS